MSVEIVIGAVTADGASGGRVPGEPWTLLVSLQPWRTEGGPVVETYLNLGCAMADVDELRAAKEALAPDATVRLLVRCTEPSRGDLLEILGPVTPDPELAAAIAKATAPRAVTTPFFGELVFDRRLDRFSGKRGAHRVHVDGDEGDVVRAEPIVARLEASLVEITATIAAQLLDLYNGTWRPSGAPVLDAAGFARSITLTDLNVGVSGGAVLSFSDGDLFAGHVIQIFVGDDGAPRRAMFSG